MRITGGHEGRIPHFSRSFPKSKEKNRRRRGGDPRCWVGVTQKALAQATPGSGGAPGPACSGYAKVVLWQRLRRGRAAAWARVTEDRMGRGNQTGLWRGGGTRAPGDRGEGDRKRNATKKKKGTLNVYEAKSPPILSGDSGTSLKVCKDFRQNSRGGDRARNWPGKGGTNC